MRFINSGQDVSLAEIEGAFRTADPRYSIADGEMRFGSETFGVLEINTPGDGTFDAEVEELEEFLEEADGNVKRVKKALSAAKSIVAVQVLSGGGMGETNLDRLDPLWMWLFKNREGLLQADGEGYYAGTKLICEVE